MEQKKQTLLEICNLSVSFQRYEGGWRQKELEVISDLCLKVYSGEIIAIVGSSGSGKSLLASAILGILPNNAKIQGEMYYKGKELTTNYQRQLRGSEIAFVPQDTRYLDPLIKVGEQVDGYRKPKQTEKRKKIFQKLFLPQKTEKLYPFQLSGGMARRVLISTAMVTEAQLIIADEPTPGMSLDQALKALEMFREFAKEGKAVILITHDIDLACSFADRVSVFYAGTNVETARAWEFKRAQDNLRHPYSKALWKALPQNSFTPIEGFQPYPKSIPKGCFFAPRCPYKTKECEEKMPPVREIRGGEVRCYNGT